MAKENKYSKPVKKAVQDYLDSGISVLELQAIIADPKSSAVNRMAAILIIKESEVATSTPQEVMNTSHTARTEGILASSRMLSVRKVSSSSLEERFSL